jgi:hypothetical protein
MAADCNDGIKDDLLGACGDMVVVCSSACANNRKENMLYFVMQP